MIDKQTANDLLASTASWTASVRAQESARADGLFRDPWAEALAGPEGRDWIAQRTPDKTLAIVLRTRYFDDFLQRVSRDQGLDQVVLMAAGYDTRAYRLNWSADTRLYELDQPAVLQHKARVLAAAAARPACHRQTVDLDLAKPWQELLVAAGFEPAKPSLWLLEGFLFYLPDEQVRQILGQVSKLAAPHSWLGFDIINSIMLNHPYTKAWVDMQAASGAPWIGTLDDPVAFLAALGWQASLSQAGQPDANFGRWTLPVLPTAMLNVPHNWFVTAQKA
ncbi:MAG TPA: SAM-dependent methyltransferase [Anaerolineaceae bacterium]|jgi:methyltransferase (TIGR00027 family)|nr:SAM-dependent methyltransferase [Anaerolineaceae bacterium]